MAQDFSPNFPQNTVNSYTVSGVKFKSSTPAFESNNDLYLTVQQAQLRAYNLGCTGYRSAITNSVGQIQYAPCSSISTYQMIMSQMTPANTTRRWYAFDPTENINDLQSSINNFGYEGFDYKNQIFERTMSNLLFRDPTKNLILEYFQRVVFALIESVKQIRNYFNYTVPFNNRKVF
jgi:hypothetical protein